MIKIQGIRKYLSMMLFELPAYVLKLHRSDSGWLYITNRKEKYIPAVKGSGLSLLGDFTSNLVSPLIFQFYQINYLKRRLLIIHFVSAASSNLLLNRK